MDIWVKIPELETLERTITDKIQRILGETNSTAEKDELEPITNELRDLQYRHKLMMIRAVDQPRYNPPIEDIERTRIELCRLMKRVDDFEEMFHKYNVPRLGGFESLEACVDAVKPFMRVWRDEAKRRRGNGEKSLIEWIRKLDHRGSDDCERRTTFEEMRMVMVDLGNHISYNLGTYFMLMAVSAEREVLKRKIQEIETVLRCLKVEEDSVVIDRFVRVMRHVRTVVPNMASTIVKRNEKSCVKVKWFESGESDLLHLIFKEVLRFEVAFSCPDLPMMLTNEVFLGMANFLRYKFEKKLKTVSSEVNNLASELQNSIREENQDQVEVVKELLDSGMKRVWDELDLKPRV